MWWRPVLVSSRSSTGHYMLPVLVANWTSTASLVDQYWFIFPLFTAGSEYFFDGLVWSAICLGFVR